MLLETERLIIRNVEPDDGKSFAEMALDGSLNDIGFTKDCGEWMDGWIIEAGELARADNPCGDYLAYTVVLKENGAVIGSVGCSYYADRGKVGITYFIGAKYRGRGFAAEAAGAYAEFFLSHYDIPELAATVRSENFSSCKVIEKAGFRLLEEKPYRDINDCKEEMYHFYCKCAEELGIKNEQDVVELVKEIRAERGGQDKCE